MSIVQELKRRNVFRMAVLYMVAAWVIVQAAEVLHDLANLPDWIGPIILGLLAVGFPIALILSWFYELTPAGISLEKDVDRAESITQMTGRRLDFIVISLLAAAVILFAYDKWWIGGPSQQSIAVLPFVNMSDDASNEYFSDGISEELLNLLAKIPELRVAGMTSAFSFKGKDTTIAKIGEKLNVAHVLEGSVRKAGNQVRITAQLIEAGSDTHLWSETYDRTLDDIFATQDEIAARVVKQLKITLLGDAPTVQTTDPEAYALVLQARYLWRQHTPDDFEKSVTLSEQALAIDPDYAAAWDTLASGYMTQAGQGLRSLDEGYMLAREAARRALALDPAYGTAHQQLGWIAKNYDRDLAAAARHYEQAFAMETANTQIISNAASMATSLGRLDQAIALAEYVVTRDPVNPSGIYYLGLTYIDAGRLDEAISSFRTTLTLSRGFIGAQYSIGKALLLKGEPESALLAMQQETDEGWRLIGLVMAHHALGQAAASDAALAELIANFEQDAAYNIAYVLAFRGEGDRAFYWLNKAVAYSDPGLSGIATDPLFANIQFDPRWLAFLESIGKSPPQLLAIEFAVTLPE